MGLGRQLHNIARRESSTEQFAKRSFLSINALLGLAITLSLTYLYYKTLLAIVNTHFACSMLQCANCGASILADGLPPDAERTRFAKASSARIQVGQP